MMAETVTVIGLTGFLVTIAMMAWLNRGEFLGTGPALPFMPSEFDCDTGRRGPGVTPIWKISDIGTPDRLANVVLAQLAIADRWPRRAPDDPDPLGCVFKVYDEIGAVEGDRRADGVGTLVTLAPGARELLVEMKCVLVRESWADQYSLTWRSLRGTDCWRLIQAFAAVLGDPRSMILSDDRQATVYFPASST